jgi:hypothetical protein
MNCLLIANLLILLTNLGVLGLCLKLYTEYAKQEMQHKRHLEGKS